MLLVYRARLGLPDATVQATFGCYALGLIPGLLCCGALSDRTGRRRVLAGLTAIYQAVSYLGFALPFALAALAGIGTPATLPIAVAALAACTLGSTTVAASRTAAGVTS